MKISIHVILFLVFGLINSGSAQVEFDSTYINWEFGQAHSVAIGDDGTIFVANGFGGLCAYIFNGENYYKEAHILYDGGSHTYSGEYKSARLSDEPNYDHQPKIVKIGNEGMIYEAGDGRITGNQYSERRFTARNTTSDKQFGLNTRITDFTIGKDSTIFVVLNYDNLLALKDDGTGLLIDHAETGYIFREDSINEIDTDGDSLVYVATDSSLWCFLFNDSVFITKAYLDGIFIEDMVLGPDGALFLAQGEYGISSYKMDGSSFTEISINNNHHCSKISVGLYGNVFSAGVNFQNGCILSVYEYDGFMFTFRDSIKIPEVPTEIKVGPDGKVYLPILYHGVQIYNYSMGVLSHNTIINFGGSAMSIVQNSDDVIFLANSWGGILAYEIENNSLITKAVLNDGSNPIDIAIGADGMIFTVGKELKAYQYDDDSFIHKASLKIAFGSSILAVGPNNSVYEATKANGINAYIFNDKSFTNAGHIDNVLNPTEMVISQNGTIFLSHENGMSAYTHVDTTISILTNLTTQGILDFVLGSDGTLFLAMGGQGVSVYRFEENSFIPVVHYVYSRSFSNNRISLGQNNVIFCSDTYLPLIAHYFFNGTGFTEIFPYLEVGSGQLGNQDIFIGADGVGFLASGQLIVFTYSGLSNVEDSTLNIPQQFYLRQNYPNPFNPSTSIEFTLPKSEYVELVIYNILGKVVSTLVSNKLNQGNHTYKFDGKNLASGIYYYQLVAGDYREVKKMILLR